MQAGLLFCTYTGKQTSKLLAGVVASFFFIKAFWTILMTYGIQSFHKVSQQLMTVFREEDGGEEAED